MRYLICSSTGLGNMILKTPMITALKTLDPAAEIDILGSNRAGALDVVHGHPQLRKVQEIHLDRSWDHRLAVAREIKRNRYDAVLLPMDGGPSWLYMVLYLSNAKRIIQHCAVPGKRLWQRAQLLLLHRRVKFIPWLAGRHEIDLNLDLVQALSNKPIARDYETSVQYRPDPGARKEFALPDRYLCLQIGAAEGLRTPKRWPGERFSRLLEALEAQLPGVALVAIGGGRESELFIKPLQAKHGRLIDTAGRTSINQLCNLLLGAEAVIAHDSGIMHLAAALGSRVVALYGPTDYTRTQPMGRNTLVLRKELDCSPCMFGVDGPEEADIFANCAEKDCMKAIEVPDVIAALREQAPGLFAA